MTRKKKEKKEFTPSKYQQDIFNFLQHGVGNLVVEACAGSGKSTTLVQAIELLPQVKKILFCAFNKDIVKELTKKVGKKDNVQICTVHSLGYNMIRKNNYRVDIVPDNDKYRKFVFSNIDTLSNNKHFKDKNDFLKYIDNVCNLVDYARYNLVSTYNEIYKLAERHTIDIIDNEIDAVIEVLEWGKENINTIDFGDMIWLPIVLYMQPYSLQYDFIFVDEAQDLSAAQRELLLKCQRMGTRYVFVGDENQSIYNFVGADIESFRKLKKLPNTTTLPLSISYRCAKNIVKFAQNYVQTIEANDDGRSGEVLRNGSLDNIADGDMVLCRNNAPLMTLYNQLIKLGKKCYIRGKDIGTNLKKIVKNTKEEYLNLDLTHEGLFSKLYMNLFEKRNKLLKDSGLDEKAVMNNPIISNTLDMIRTLEALSEDIKTSQELIEKIDNVFSDKSKKGIVLSTVHKAKGLEANNVYITCPSLMPCQSATQDWELEQEHNLMYVAFTRAKDRLVFLDETEFNEKMTKENESLKSIEKQVNFLYKKSTVFIPTISSKTQTVLNRIEKIKLPERGGKVIWGKENDKQTKKSNDVNTLMSLTNRRITRKKI